LEGDFIKINRWLLPFSWLYGLASRFRNTLFETGILKSKSFAIPVISVGNITVGGTGKTPHVEYLIRLLQQKQRVAVLSRGYKRKSHGFQIADKNCTARTVGDEPFQIKKKYPNIVVAVDKKRVHGIETLTHQLPDLDVILLDDAFQHRYVKPGINILLVDYHRLIIYDELLPAGRLREPLKGKDRADIVIITKCPKDLKPMDYRVLTKAMDLYPYQQIYFTMLEYGKLTPMCKGKGQLNFLEDLSKHNVLLLTGIASPRQMKEDISPFAAHLSSLSFPDHHDFKPKDIERINSEFDTLPSPKCIITTEKDAARIVETKGLNEEVKRNIYILPVCIKFMLDQEEKFNENILDYVRKNSRNSILAKGKDDHKPKDGHYTGNRSRTISFRNN